MNDITALAQRTPERQRHDWSQSVMHDCDFCHQWSLTVTHDDGARICASCCDAEYTSELEVANAALVEALEKAQRANAAQDDHINQQQDRIDTLEKRNAELGGQLSRYSMSPGQADQRMCESRAARDALGFGKDADNVAPIDLRERMDGMKARITSLESRTVTVKLPAEYLNADGSVNADMANTCPVVSAYREAHRAAGIQVIEGEQKNG